MKRPTPPIHPALHFDLANGLIYVGVLTYGGPVIVRREVGALPEICKPESLDCPPPFYPYDPLIGQWDESDLTLFRAGWVNGVREPQMDNEAREPSPPLPGSPDLIEPNLLRISSAFRSGRLTPEQLAEPMPSGWSRVPDALRPFLEVPRVERLIEVLNEHPALYWHPLVAKQIRYLRRLSRDPEEWHRLDWWPQEDKYGAPSKAPKEVIHAKDVLTKLVEAHVTGVLPMARIVRERAHKRPGRKGGLLNPAPIAESCERIGGEILTEDFEHLRSSFRKTLDKAKSRLKRQATEYSRLAQQVFEREAGEGNVAWWIDARDWETPTMLPSGPSRTDDPLEFGFGNESSIETLWSWRQLDFGDAFDDVNESARSLKVRPEAYLAYAVLGALLGARPRKIRDIIDNYSHPRRRSTSR